MKFEEHNNVLVNSVLPSNTAQELLCELFPEEKIRLVIQPRLPKQLTWFSVIGISTVIFLGTTIPYYALDSVGVHFYYLIWFWILYGLLLGVYAYFYWRNRKRFIAISGERILYQDEKGHLQFWSIYDLREFGQADDWCSHIPPSTLNLFGKIIDGIDAHEYKEISSIVNSNLHGSSRIDESIPLNIDSNLK
jgi:hypothetical protein